MEAEADSGATRAEAAAEAARSEVLLRDVLAAADRLLALDLDASAPAAAFSPDWPETDR